MMLALAAWFAKSINVSCKLNSTSVLEVGFRRVCIIPLSCFKPTILAPMQNGPALMTHYMIISIVSRCKSVRVLCYRISHFLVKTNGRFVRFSGTYYLRGGMPRFYQLI